MRSALLTPRGQFMIRLALFVTLGVLCLTAVLSLADAVYVTELPLGDREIVGVAAHDAHVLRLNKSGAIVAWSDAYGNRFLSPVSSQPTMPALELSRGERVIFPTDGCRLVMKAISPQQ